MPALFNMRDTGLSISVRAIRICSVLTYSSRSCSASFSAALNTSLSFWKIGQIYITQKLNDVFSAAEKEAEQLRDEYVSTEYILIALTEIDSSVSRILKSAGISKDKILKVLVEIRGAQTVTDQNPEDKYQALTRYSRDLTELARKG